MNGIKVVFATSSGTRKHRTHRMQETWHACLLSCKFTCFGDFATTAPLHVFSSRDRKGAVVVHPYSFDRIALILASMLSLSTSPAM